MNDFDIKKNLVVDGKSEIFSSWQEVVTTLTAEEFLENLKWVCDDPCENGDGTGILTREIGLTNSGIVRINRVYDKGITIMYRLDNGRVWEGDFFKVPCIEKFVKNADKVKRMGYADSDGMISIRFKPSISARDRI